MSEGEKTKNRNKISESSLEEPKKRPGDQKIDLSDKQVFSKKESAKRALKGEQKVSNLSMEKAEVKKLKSHFSKLSKKPEKTLKLEKEIARLDKALQKSLKDNLYLRAEFENFKKRALEEQSKLIRYGGERFIVSLADEVLDDLDRAVSSARKSLDFEDLKKGLSLIQKKLSQVLINFGIHVIDPKGKMFDPSYQEALSYVKTSNIPEGHVAETFKKAYKMHDKVIRPAQVVLAKKEI